MLLTNSFNHFRRFRNEMQSSQHLLQPIQPLGNLGLDPPQVRDDLGWGGVGDLRMLYLFVAVQRQIKAAGRGNLGRGDHKAGRGAGAEQFHPLTQGKAGQNFGQVVLGDIRIA